MLGVHGMPWDVLQKGIQKMSILIKNGRVIDPDTRKDGRYDILIEEDKIVKVDQEIKEEAEEVIDAEPATSGRKTKASASPDLPEAWRKKVRMAVKSDKLAPSSYSVVYRAISGSQNKTELNNQLVKAFQSSKGGRVYGHVREIFEQYSKESN